jgi:4-hydroxythreonine-4-phosphate dehydrogenase
VKPPVAITCGDPAGVGPDVIAAWARAEPEAAANAAIIGPRKWLNTLPTGFLIPVGLEDYQATPGKPDPEGALVAWAALDRAAAGCKSGEFSAAVTGPISKERMAAIGWPHPGQTEYFAAKWGGKPTMGFCGGKLRVVLLTWHIPFRFVPRHLTKKDFVRTVTAAQQLARSAGIEQPRIGVCGLNPHAGEGGLLGSEEFEIIDPLLDVLRQQHPGLSATLPADTLFARQARGEFDVIIALYHDQGLAPLKLVDFDEAVNVTLGLPHVRTSPDHGTAYGIAGTGRASARSFTNAVHWASRLACLSDPPAPQ